MRRGACLVALVVGLMVVSVWAQPTGPAAVRQATFEPLAATAVAPGATRRYETSSTLLPGRTLRWRVERLQTLALPAGGRHATLRMLPEGAVFGPPARTFGLVAEPRGIFLSAGKPGASDPTVYGPERWLLPADEMARLDSVWHFEGLAPVNMALSVLMLSTLDADLQPLAGQYHVLSVGPLSTPAGDFDQAIQVSAVERLSLQLGGETPVESVLRLRRWFVPGIGLAQERITFVTMPGLGEITTRLIGHPGLIAVTVSEEQWPAT